MSEREKIEATLSKIHGLWLSENDMNKLINFTLSDRKRLVEPLVEVYDPDVKPDINHYYWAVKNTLKNAGLED